MTGQSISLGRYQIDGRILIGRPNGDQIDVVNDGDDLPGALAAPDGEALRSVPAAQATLLLPLDRASRIFAIAINYPAHGAEAKFPPPVRPLIFYKAPSNFVAHGAALNPNKKLTRQFDYEGEIAVVIGRSSEDATLDNALSFVAGVCALNDGSARDMGKVALGKEGADSTHWPDWTAGKSLDGSSTLGPTIACGAEVLRALRERTLRVATRLNGETVQDACMAEMQFSTEQIIVTLSSYMRLEPGDVIATGTPAGVGSARGRFLQTGDRLEVEVSGLDVLSVKVG